MKMQKVMSLQILLNAVNAVLGLPPVNLKKTERWEERWISVWVRKQLVAAGWTFEGDANHKYKASKLSGGYEIVVDPIEKLVWRTPDGCLEIILKNWDPMDYGYEWNMNIRLKLPWVEMDGHRSDTYGTPATMVQLRVTPHLIAIDPMQYFRSHPEITDSPHADLLRQLLKALDYGRMYEREYADDPDRPGRLPVWDCDSAAAHHIKTILKL